VTDRLFNGEYAIKYENNGIYLDVLDKADGATAVVATAYETVKDSDFKTNYLVYRDGKAVLSTVNLETAKRFVNGNGGGTVVFSGVIFANNNLTVERQTDCITDYSAKNYEIYRNGRLIGCFGDCEAALEFARKYDGSFVVGEVAIYANYPDYYYFNGKQRLYVSNVNEYFATLAKNSLTSPLYRSSDGAKLWEKTAIGTYRIGNVPVIKQNPELPRGCEVTSLAMLLNYHGVSVSKMSLAEEIKKVPYKDDPNNGFIGDMYHLNTFGLGVYHTPIAELADKYCNGRVLDLTGCSFDALNYYLKNGKPVWVINNTSFDYLSEDYFKYWYDTPSGTIKYTNKEHSVLITGVSKDYVYINDPLTGTKRTLDKAKFVKGWQQMGSQAVTVF
jgi:uncharacterized protein YvpB